MRTAVWIWFHGLALNFIARDWWWLVPIRFQIDSLLWASEHKFRNLGVSLNFKHLHNYEFNLIHLTRAQAPRRKDSRKLNHSPGYFYVSDIYIFGVGVGAIIYITHKTSSALADDYVAWITLVVASSFLRLFIHPHADHQQCGRLVCARANFAKASALRQWLHLFMSALKSRARRRRAQRAAQRWFQFTQWPALIYTINRRAICIPPAKRKQRRLHKNQVAYYFYFTMFQLKAPKIIRFSMQIHCFEGWDFFLWSVPINQSVLILPYWAARCKINWRWWRVALRVLPLSPQHEPPTRGATIQMTYPLSKIAFGIKISRLWAKSSGWGAASAARGP